jgi:hypothetical protein
MRLARRFESLRRVCPKGGADMRLIAFITKAATVERMLLAFGEPPRPPPITPARGPPAWDDAPEPMPDWDLLQQPDPDFEFDQRMVWSPPSLAGAGAAPLVFRRHDAPQQRAPSTSRRPCLFRPRRSAAPLFGVDHTSRPRHRPLPRLPGRSGWLEFPIRKRSSVRGIGSRAEAVDALPNGLARRTGPSPGGSSAAIGAVLGGGPNRAGTRLLV